MVCYALPDGESYNSNQVLQGNVLNAPNQHRMGHIGSIRGIAALLVLYHHETSNFTNIPGVNALGTLLYDIASYSEFWAYRCNSVLCH